MKAQLISDQEKAEVLLVTLEKSTKSEPDGDHPSSHYLVVEDADKPSTWHLPYKTPAGKIDRRRLGAAWAALHGGFRGNKYGGPNKASALRKLKAAYREAGMKTPDEKEEN